jgi:hypothetical protein
MLKRGGKDFFYKKTNDHNYWLLLSNIWFFFLGVGVNPSRFDMFLFL